MENNAFNYCEIKHLLSNNNQILLIIGAKDCILCNMLIDSLYNCSIIQYYIDMDYCDINFLVHQTLRTSGFPTTYVLNNEYRIVGEVKGLRDFGKRFSEVMISTNNHQENANEMLNWSFKALLAYLEDDFENMRGNAVNSLKYGSYFFNNYLLYLYEIRNGVEASGDYYKTAALNSLEGADFYIYENLIREIDPEFAEHYSPNHIHNEHCIHHH